MVQLDLLRDCACDWLCGRYAFGLQLPGAAALAVRILSLMHWTLAGMMFIGWLAVPGRVLIGQLKAKGSEKSKVPIDDSPFGSRYGWTRGDRAVPRAVW